MFQLCDFVAAICPKANSSNLLDFKNSCTLGMNGHSSTYNAMNIKLQKVKGLWQNGELLANILLHKKLILEVVDFFPDAFGYIPPRYQLDFAKEILPKSLDLYLIRLTERMRGARAAGGRAARCC